MFHIPRVTRHSDLDAFIDTGFEVVLPYAILVEDMLIVGVLVPWRAV